MNVVPLILLMFLPVFPPLIAEVVGRIGDRLSSARAPRSLQTNRTAA